MTRRLSVIVLLVFVAAAVGARAQAPPRITTPQPAVRPQLRRRLLPRQLPADRRLLAEARDASPIASTVAVDRQDRRGPRPADGDRDVAREPQESRALQGHLAPARARRGPDRRRRRARSRAKARPSSGSTAACTPPRRSARSSSARWSIRWSAAPTTRRCGFSNDVDHPVRARESRRQRSRRRLVHAQPRSAAALAQRPAAAVPEVHRPRQQPRLLRVDAGRDREHESRAVPRVVPADSLQPPPERAGRARSCSRRRCAIRSTTTRIRCSCSASSRSASRCTRGSRRKASRARRCDRAARTTAGGTAASATPRRSTTRSRF